MSPRPFPNSARLRRDTARSAVSPPRSKSSATLRSWRRTTSRCAPPSRRASQPPAQLDRARQYLDARTAGDNAALWLTLAEIELSGAKLDEGRAAVAKALALDGSTRQSIIALGCRLAAKSPDAGYQCIDAAVEVAVRAEAYAEAAAAIHEFVAIVRHHLIALMRLVEICVDGGLDTTMSEAQALLADAYLEVGRGLEARIISEDLVAREPWNTANIDRFRRALVMLGEADPDTVIADRLSGESPFLATDNLDLNEGVFFEEPAAVAAAPAANPAAEPAGKSEPTRQGKPDGKATKASAKVRRLRHRRRMRRLRPRRRRQAPGSWRNSRRKVN